MVLGVHCNFLSLGEPTQATFKSAPFSTVARYFFQYACFFGVNVFVMISGFFGIKLSFKRLLNYLFYLAYWGFFIVGVIWLINMWHPFLVNNLSIWQFIKGNITSGELWFIREYLILMVLSLPLNEFVKNADNKTIIWFLILYFGLETAEIFIQGLGSFSNGYSVLSFIGIYVLGSFLKINLGKFKSSAKVYFCCYLLLILILTCGIIVSKYIIGLPPAVSGYIQSSIKAYSGPANILGAALLLITFAKMDFHIPFINYVAASSFGVYLLHSNPVIFGSYLKWCNHIHNQYDLLSYMGLLALTFIGIFVFVTILDQGRKYLAHHIL